MAPKTPTISVIERRLQGPSALQAETRAIPLTEPEVWTLRWGNSDIRTDRVWELINVLGWQYVTPADIAAPLEDIGATERDGRVVRGERGKEVLLKMRRTDFRQVQQKKTQENLARTFDKTKVTQDVLTHVGTAHGSQAAEWMTKRHMTVVDARERAPLDE